MFNWKEILKSVLVLVLPIIYGLIQGAIPGFPIDEGAFIDTIIWLIFGLLLGGQYLKARVATKMDRRGFASTDIKAVTNIGK